MRIGLRGGGGCVELRGGHDQEQIDDLPVQQIRCRTATKTSANKSMFPLSTLLKGLCTIPKSSICRTSPVRQGHSIAKDGEKIRDC